MTKLQIRARLIEQGISLRQFALKHGYDPRTVTQVLDRWAGSPTLPSGRISFSIMHDLSVAVGSELIPGLLNHPFASAS
ncbi:hypothetical protein [Pseudomonas sp.]|jgi:gp16 family phage-associated protein|uniref:hypothetical protein n=1 Tax=Pseudomonas sp. TaxID=306 RepID=UPI0037C9B3B1